MHRRRFSFSAPPMSGKVRKLLGRHGVSFGSRKMADWMCFGEIESGGAQMLTVSTTRCGTLFLLVESLLVTVSPVALAMPTKEELARTQPIVLELMKPCVSELKNGSMSATEVGDKAVEFSGEAETPAGKYLLLKGAVAYYVRDKSYDKAADTIELIMEQFPDIEPETLLDITTRAKKVVTAKTAPRLFAIHNVVLARVNGAKVLKSLETELKKKPTDKTLIRGCAELTAATGKWEEALPLFVKLGGDIGKMAQEEIDGTATAAMLANFWWNYNSQQRDAKDAIRNHAVALYRDAIERDELKGLQKTLAEQRMAEVETIGDKAGANPRVGERAGAKTRMTSSALSARFEKGLVGYWPFDGNANDATKNRNNGILHNMTQAEDRFGNANKAYRFGGSSYIEVAHSDTLNMTRAITMTAWIKPQRWWGPWIVIMQKGNRWNCNYHFEINMRDNKVFFCYPAIVLSVDAQIGLELNKWQHVALTYESGKRSCFYCNGVQIGNWQISKDLPPNNSSLVIGYDPMGGDEYFVGDMDDVRLFNRALSEKEIQELYKAECPKQ